MVAKNLGGIVPDVSDDEFTDDDRELLDAAAALLDKARSEVQLQELHRYVGALAGS